MFLLGEVQLGLGLLADEEGNLKVDKKLAEEFSAMLKKARAAVLEARPGGPASSPSEARVGSWRTELEERLEEIAGQVKGWQKDRNFKGDFKVRRALSKSLIDVDNVVGALRRNEFNLEKLGADLGEIQSRIGSLGQPGMHPEVLRQLGVIYSKLTEARLRLPGENAPRAGLEEERYRVGGPASNKFGSRPRVGSYRWSKFYRASPSQVFVVVQMEQEGWSGEQRALPKPRYALVKMVGKNRIAVIHREGEAPPEIILRREDWSQEEKRAYLMPAGVVLSRTPSGRMKVGWNNVPGSPPAGAVEVYQAVPAAGLEEGEAAEAALQEVLADPLQADGLARGEVVRLADGTQLLKVPAELFGEAPTLYL
ncbi:MAG: hypothetical protein HYZ94_02525, partial [Candidatus Omnitrophica bacterium]|nr:hypothetical protein [Candidatus Omnitrophota bacterium]